MKFTMKNRMKPCLCISLAIMAIALVMTLVGYGMNLGIDFTGGTLMTYEMGGQFETADVDAALKACGYDRTFTVEMIPFSRLPDLVLPDQALAEKVVGELRNL